jgi:hypothetical protein
MLDQYNYTSIALVLRMGANGTWIDTRAILSSQLRAQVWSSQAIRQAIQQLELAVKVAILQHICLPFHSNSLGEARHSAGIQTEGPPKVPQRLTTIITLSLQKNQAPLRWRRSLVPLNKTLNNPGEGIFLA